MLRVISSGSILGFLLVVAGSRTTAETLPMTPRGAVCHDILDFPVRVVDIVGARPLATPRIAMYSDNDVGERPPIRCVNCRFSVAPSTTGASLLPAI